MGLPTALLLARSGMTVIGYDINQKVISQLKEEKLPFTEPGLVELFDEAKNNFTASEELQKSDAFILTLPTPLKPNKKCDLSYINTALESLKSIISDDNLIVLESTVPPGTTIGIIGTFLQKTGKRFYLSYVSEKALPGKTIIEMKKNHRIIGGLNYKSALLTKKLYCRFVTAPIHLTDCITAESVKLLENTYRDVNIALVNEIAIRFSQLGIDVWEAIELANYHPRVNLHKPGPGAGGHCIAIDPWFLVNEDTNLIRQARLINDRMPNHIASIVIKMLNNVQQPIVVLLGVSYKADVDDDRESPTYTIEKILQAKGFEVRLYDPLLINDTKIFNELNYATNNADCLVLVTDHREFKKIEPQEIRNMKNKNIIDTRNFLNHSDWDDAGFRVEVLGKSSTNIFKPFID